jgi:hypothetical protein
MRKTLYCILMALSLVACDRTVKPDPDLPLTPSVTDLRTGEIATGSEVTLSDLVVTTGVGLAGHGFFAQDPDAVNNGGIMVYCTAPIGGAVFMGDLISVTGTYQEYYGQSQILIADASAISKGGSAALPPPIVLLIADLVSDSAAEPYESMLVRTGDASPTATATDAGTGIWSLEGLVVDKYLYATSPLPLVDDVIVNVTGVLYYANSDFKLEPRSAADVVLPD